MLAANVDFASSFQPSDRTGRAAKGLAIVTCMDSRVLPMEAVGMSIGDAKILRNAGARVTQDVLRTLALASYLLEVNRILVMPHTDCRMAKDPRKPCTEIQERYGVNTWSMEFDDHRPTRRPTHRRGAHPIVPLPARARAGRRRDLRRRDRSDHAAGRVTTT